MAGVENFIDKVKHDDTKKEFFVEMPAGEGCEARAVLQYDWVGTDQVDLYHTEVPPVFRGKGFGKILAKAALDHFTEKKIKMVPTCTFIQKYVRDNPNSEFEDLIVNS